MLINDPSADSRFKTIEVAGIKRLSQGWQLLAAYSATKSTSRSVQQQQGTNGHARCALNPNAEIYAANNTWEWTGKMSGAYTFPLRDYRVGELRAPERDAAGAAGALYRRPGDSIDRGERRAHRQPAPPQHQPGGPPCGEAVFARRRHARWSCARMSSMR